MQVSPALPWAGNEQQGGTITLQVPVTRKQLLDGAVIFGLSYHGDTELVTAQMTNNSVVVRGDGVEYQVTNVIADNVEYSELVLVKTQPTSDGLVSVERVQPLQYVDPTRVYSFVAFKGYLFMVDRTNDKVTICDNDGGGLAWAVTEYGHLENTSMPPDKNDLGSELAALYNNLYGTQLSFDTSYEDGHAEIDEPVFRIPDTVSVRTLHSLPWSDQSSDSVLRLPADVTVQDVLENQLKFYIGNTQGIQVADVVSEGNDICLKVDGVTVYVLPKWQGVASEIAISHDSSARNAYLYLARLADAYPVALRLGETNNRMFLKAVLQNGKVCEVRINGVYPTVSLYEEESPQVEITNQSVDTSQLGVGIDNLSPIELRAGSKVSSLEDIDLLTQAVINGNIWSARLASGETYEESFGRGQSLQAFELWIDWDDPQPYTDGGLRFAEGLSSDTVTKCAVSPALPYDNAEVHEGLISLPQAIEHSEVWSNFYVVVKDNANNYYNCDRTHNGDDIQYYCNIFPNEKLAEIPNFVNESENILFKQYADVRFVVASILFNQESE